MATPGVPDRVTGSCTATVAGHLGELCELALGHASGTRLESPYCYSFAVNDLPGKLN